MFYFKLALRLGMTVEQLLNSISSYELSEWMVFYRYEPFDDQRQDLVGGIIASTMANCHRSEKTKAFKPSDFMPYRKKEPVNQAALLRAQLGHLVKK